MDETRRTVALGEQPRPDTLPDPVKALTAAELRENQIAAEQIGFDAGVRLGFVTQQLPAILWTTDKELRFKSAVGSGLAAIGLRSEQVVGVGLTEFFSHDPGGPRNIEAHRAALRGQATSTDARFGARVYQCRIDALRDARGEITGTIGVALDITDRKLMEAKLIQAERLASLGTLAAGVAHEINNPLTYIMANIGFVSERLSKLTPEMLSRIQAVGKGTGKTPAAQLAELTTALSEAQEGTIRVRRIVRDLKILARGDEEQYGPVDVRHVIESAVGMMWNHIRHRAELVRELDDVPLVRASESRLGQVILNLLINATQAIREGQVAVNQIRIGTRTDPIGRAVITVSDTGEGIPPDVMGRVFDPFFTTKPIGIGTGLGLFICHGIVKALGGEIFAESPPGQGATFRVILPPARGDARRADEPKNENQERRTSSRTTPR
jgi:signal transduction histidine kinase